MIHSNFITDLADSSDLKGTGININYYKIFNKKKKKYQCISYMIIILKCLVKLSRATILCILLSLETIFVKVKKTIQPVA